MIIIKYNSKKHKEIIKSLVHALKRGKTVVYPTDTSYGLACAVTNRAALAKIYRIKERGFNRPIHIVAPSLAYAKRIAVWSPIAARLTKRFWPGPLTLVLPLRVKTAFLKKLSAGTGTIGLRRPGHRVALDLAKGLGAPITATSANPSGRRRRGVDSYSIADILKQFEQQEHRPDIILDAGRLPRRKPSTVVRVSDSIVKILRSGPVTKRQIIKVLKQHNIRVVEP